MKRFKKHTGGFTLIEALIVIAIMGIVTSGLGQMLNTAIYAWNFGSANIAVNMEGRNAVTALTKFMQYAQAPTIKISRINTNQPANSYVSGKLAETVYVTTSSPGSCGFTTSASDMVGGAGAEVEMFQYGRKLYARVPKLAAGSSISNPSTINYTYTYMTVTSNLDSFMVTFNDSKKEKSVSVAVRLSKMVYKNRPPIRVLLKQQIVLKHSTSAGFYGN
ncbi:MAG: hypothetical protein CVV21_09030 [Candidatus Goldiibacteriota bacterium HGW-Goldbacteria-1]|jgi:prepilin-type N-terminal cleavage/methylation domain-containing protein|nr:MAG: hypothetical protein CVV21_09030 [Candidatus Goldiibacteriota bacterium HGW-Goldbacteria-1]